VRILFDQGTPAPLRRVLRSHDVRTAFEEGWSTLTNGDLLRRAEESGFEVFVTTDSSLRYQQTVEGRRLAIVVLLSTSWPRIQAVAASISEAVDGTQAGAYVEITIP